MNQKTYNNQPRIMFVIVIILLMLSLLIFSVSAEVIKTKLTITPKVIILEDGECYEQCCVTEYEDRKELWCEDGN